MNPAPGVLRKKSGYAVLAVAMALMFLLTPNAKADYSVTCDNNQSVSLSPSVMLSCSGTTPFGATWSGSGSISLDAAGEIGMGSQMTFSGYGPHVGFSMAAGMTGTIVGVNNGTPIVLNSYFAGELTNGTGPYGGSYAYNFSGGTDVQLLYETLLVINGTTVIPLNSSDATAICNPPTSGGDCTVSAPSGNGDISVPARTGSYQTTVGSTLNIGMSYFNSWTYASGTSGTFSYNLDPGLSFSATDPTTGLYISGLSMVLSDGTIIPINTPNTTSAVPEPSSLVLLGTGAVGLFGPFGRKLLLRRKR